MPTTTQKNGLILMCLAWGFLTGLAPARGDLIVNGDSSNGLNGWSVSDSSLVSVVNGHAVISETPTGQEVDLYQSFTVPTSGVTTLSFKLLDLTGDPGNPVAAFGASLLAGAGTSGSSLVDTVGGDSFYTQDVGSSGFAATGVTLNPASGDLPLLLTLDISSLAAGTEATILFRLISGLSADLGSTNASVTLDDVSVPTASGPGPGPNPVPEPSTAIIVALGAPVFFAYVRRRRKRAA